MVACSLGGLGILFVLIRWFLCSFSHSFIYSFIHSFSFIIRPYRYVVKHIHTYIYTHTDMRLRRNEERLNFIHERLCFPPTMFCFCSVMSCYTFAFILLTFTWFMITSLFVGWTVKWTVNDSVVQIWIMCAIILETLWSEWIMWNGSQVEGILDLEGLYAPHHASALPQKRWCGYFIHSICGEQPWMTQMFEQIKYLNYAWGL